MSVQRDYPRNPLLAASICVLREGRVLLATRTRPPMDQLYTLPGGLVEPGETLAEAALRELQEEVGVTARILGLIRPIEVIERDPDGAVRVHYVICAHAAQWVSGEPQTGPEAGAVIWADPQALASLPTTPHLPEIIAGALTIAARVP
ncbi:MAG: NUDIX hydrolase [Salinarimonas sp.]|nr:NUDIX hydrolase [Salinarimonas sp.]